MSFSGAARVRLIPFSGDPRVCLISFSGDPLVCLIPFNGDLRLRLMPFSGDPQGSARRCSCASSTGSARNAIVTPRETLGHNCENDTAPGGRCTTALEQWIREHRSRAVPHTITQQYHLSAVRLNGVPLAACPPVRG